MAGGGGGGGSPCGACKFLRRKCASDCVFAPYFSSEQGPTRFAAIHKVFGASNVAKLLTHLPVQHRCQAVVTIAYEAQARVRDPVYGCVSHIFALQHQVTYLQAQLMQVKAQLASGLINNSNHPDNQQWRLLATNINNSNNDDNQNSNFVGIDRQPEPANYCQGSTYTNNNNNHPISPQSSLESCIDQVGDANFGLKVEQNYSTVQENYQFSMQQHYYHPSGKKRLQEVDDDMGELQELALRMMRN
ncbi:hypothetical protein V2J09_015634 [Rumex salicifolius]